MTRDHAAKLAARVIELIQVEAETIDCRPHRSPYPILYPLVRIHQTLWARAYGGFDEYELPDIAPDVAKLPEEMRAVFQA